MIHRLPTTADRKYRGKYPSRIYSVSSGTDVNGDKCAHIELNNGRRYTVTYNFFIDRVNMPKCGAVLWDLLDPDGRFHIKPMSQAQYDAWLARLTAEREAAPAMRDAKRANAYLKHGYMTQGPFRDEPVESRARLTTYGRAPNQHGDGSDLPCGYQIKWEGKWRNCYVMCYGNGFGTPYIKTQGGRIYVGGLGE